MPTFQQWIPAFAGMTDLGPPLQPDCHCNQRPHDKPCYQPDRRLAIISADRDAAEHAECNEDAATGWFAFGFHARPFARATITVNAAFTSLIRQIEAGGGYEERRDIGDFRMHLPYVDAGSVAEADALIAAFGDDAGFEAASRADASRERGNVVMFCRWRQIERLIVLLATEDVVGTVH